MMKTIKYLLFTAVLISFTACNDPEDVLEDFNIDTSTPVLPALDPGTVDFSNYVSLGASFTAGFTDGALFIASQENSFPNILAQQFANVGGGAFPQPLMNDNIGGFLVGGNVAGNPRLFFDGSGPAVLPATPTTEATSVLSGTFKNVGVPGAKSVHLLFDGYGNPANLLTNPPMANPYFVRMASAPNATMLGDAIGQNPTFFTLSEIGGNDVLGYATSGGDGTNPITPPSGPPGVGFDQTFAAIVTTLTSGQAKGVVTNVPYITDLPHFTTVPYNPVPLDNATATALNQGYAAYNAGLQQALAALEPLGLLTAEEVARRTISFSAGEGNALVIIDENLTDLGAINPAFAALPQYRQATADDLFVLPLSSLIPNGYGTQIPLEDKWSLTPEEQAEIKDATDAYNATIAAVASANDNVALLDLNSILAEASTTGIEYDGFIMNTNLVTGGLVSLDGIHLTARGYALMANKFLETIDAAFGSNFIESGTIAKLEDYPTNYSPTLQ